jgi:hypothetical protein
MFESFDTEPSKWKINRADSVALFGLVLAPMLWAFVPSFYTKVTAALVFASACVYLIFHSEYMTERDGPTKVTTS